MAKILEWFKEALLCELKGKSTICKELSQIAERKWVPEKMSDLWDWVLKIASQSDIETLKKKQFNGTNRFS